MDAANGWPGAVSEAWLTFRALVEAIVPGMPPGAGGPGAEYWAGAADLGIHEYLIWELDHSLALACCLGLANIPLAAPTATMLNEGAAQYIAAGKALIPPCYTSSGGWPFASLSPCDRIRVLAMLEQLDMDIGPFPLPYRHDGGLIRFMADYLNWATMFGFYSEWSAYGTTRLRTPTERVLECFPTGWRQAGYPGVAKGYRALRGFLLTIQREGGGSF
ncbi:hypothetical protein [Paenibacillus sp. y28]|uniref:hypothetical protein n=1 Tax=Paenibacillus sp. y28 TaxID=3129110 RepID=UPI003015CC62